MERQGFTVITVLIIIFAILHSGETKRCYSCNSVNSETCASNPSEFETTECNLFCVKCDYEMLTGATGVQRNCGVLTVTSLELATKFDCNSCDTNLCNNANALPTSLGVVALGCLALFWTIRFALTDSY
ncbi:hypothetical protein ACS0PU_010620 [Formica fusca]